MTSVMRLDAWVSASRDERVAHVREVFGPKYEVVPGAGPPSFLDTTTRSEWVMVPAGMSRLGMSEAEEEQARALVDEPFLTFEEMRPTRMIKLSGFLAMKNPVDVDTAKQAGLAVEDEVGPGRAALVHSADAESLAAAIGGVLPSEAEWEHLCRGGTTSLFWFGSHLPDPEILPKVLGMERPAIPNGFGVEALFFAEWTRDRWSPTLDGTVEEGGGLVVRGGAARFWPWQVDGEWAGCASAFRMPERDLGGVAAAVRLVRHPATT